MTESKVRSARLRMAPRTARPSTTPAISPITTSARIRNSVTNSLVRGPLMWLTTCGASSTPGDRAEHHPDERQQGAERAGTPAGDGGDERDREDGKIEPL